jgi:hypothetical protein
MSRVCGTCGSQLTEGKKFCGKCGGATSSAERPPSPSTPPAYTAFAQPQASVTSVSAPARSNTLLKVGVAAVAIIFVGGIVAFGAIYCAMHKVKEKVQEVKNRVEGEIPSSAAPSAPGGLAALVQKATASPPSNDDDAGGFKGDPCRFLSKEEVSLAVGIEIIRADPPDSGCNYIAKGDPADMVSKHMTSMVTSHAKSNGSPVSAQQQKMMQQITGDFFKQQESSDKDLSKQTASGAVSILSVSFSSGHAETESRPLKTAGLTFKRRS